MPGLADRLEGARMDDLRVVVLPDFFVDHFVSLSDHDSFRAGTEAIHSRGGGNLLTGAQSLRLGGNAANTAYALGRLGVPTTLVTRTDAFGAAVIRSAFEGLPVDTSLVQVGTRTSSTVALEFQEDAANVMLSDPGPLRSFGPQDLDPDGDGAVWRAIDQADAVAVTNWSQTIDHGTHLLEGVTKRARAAGAFTFLDTGDPTHRGEDARRLLSDGQALAAVDAWGMNENELRFFAGHVVPDGHGLVEAARAIKRVYKGRLDVHTAEEVFTLEQDQPVRCGTFRIEPLRLTGSGDAWNAGNLVGQMLGLEPEERLCLGNAVAALSITAADVRPPDRQGLVRFLRHRPVPTRESPHTV